MSSWKLYLHKIFIVFVVCGGRYLRVTSCDMQTKILTIDERGFTWTGLVPSFPTTRAKPPGIASSH